jgi:LPXTG-motif cell wall-anchored protein
MKRIGKRRGCGWIPAMLLLIAVCASALTARAAAPINRAVEPIDYSEGGSLVLTYQYEGHAIEGVTFRFYHVATMNTDGQYILTPEFADSHVDLDIEDEAELIACTAALDGYVLQMQAEQKTIEPEEIGQTDAQGKVVFDDLEMGIYLVTGDTLRIRDRMYIPMETLVFLPDLTDSGEWDYDLEAQVKSEARTIDEGDGTISLKAIKIWKDSGYESARPSEVTVELFGDGVSYGKVTLNKSNNWQYQWDELDETVYWQLTEVNVPSGYTVTVEPNDLTFVVTNTYHPNDNPKDPGKPGGTPKSNPLNPVKLPQTGQLWWPVPILLILGAAMILAGLVIKRRRSDG